MGRSADCDAGSKNTAFANEILKAASVFFAAEVDRPPRRW